MKTKPKWEKDDLFEALQECCVKGGADKRALPHFIRQTIDQEVKEAVKEIRKVENPFEKLRKIVPQNYYSAEAMKYLILSELDKLLGKKEK